MKFTDAGREFKSHEATIEKLQFYFEFRHDERMVSHVAKRRFALAALLQKIAADTEEDNKP